MTDKELIEVSNRAWDAFADQMPEEFTGRDLLKIAIRFVVNIANTVDMKPTTVCMLMYDRLNGIPLRVLIALKAYYCLPALLH